MARSPGLNLKNYGNIRKLEIKHGISSKQWKYPEFRQNSDTLTQNAGSPNHCFRHGISNLWESPKPLFKIVDLALGVQTKRSLAEHRRPLRHARAAMLGTPPGRAVGSGTRGNGWWVPGNGYWYRHRVWGTGRCTRY